MNPAGAVLIVAGIWVCAQVFAGNALERLGIVKPDAVDPPGGPGIGGALTPPAAPSQGISGVQQGIGKAGA